MKRPSLTLRQWHQLRRCLCHITPATSTPGAINFLTPSSAVLPASRNEPSHTRRPFHSTRTQCAQRKPMPAMSTDRRRHAVQRYKYPTSDGYLDENGVYCQAMSSVFPASMEEWVRHNTRWAMDFYRVGVRDGVVPSAISIGTYRKVVMQLARDSYISPPDGHRIRAISQDVDTVFRIGFAATTTNLDYREWVMSACALAQARLPTVIIVARQLKGKKMPIRNYFIEEVEVLARKQYPPALLIQAKIAGLRGDFNLAFKLLENKGFLDSPWRLYALLRAQHDVRFKSEESRLKSNEALRMAALVYQDPEALVDYASHMMNEGNLDMYEECMSKAATAGNSKACLFLANFYYLTFHGMYPTRGERQEPLNTKNKTSAPKTKGEPTPSKSVLALLSQSPAFKSAADTVYEWASSFFNQSMKRPQYRELAEDWYHLAFSHGEPRAAFMTALMARENGHSIEGRVFLDEAESEPDPDFQAKLKALKERWYDTDYDPSLPRRMLEVR